MEGILCAQIALVQTYLRERYGRPSADLTHILHTGLDEALLLLHDRDMAQACTMFTHMVSAS